MPNVIAERYRLTGQLGQGGMGRVWAARDELLARDVAIKELVPPPGLTAAELAALRERAIREARAIAALDQPNVVRVFDVVFRGDDPWIVMELVPSRSLFDTVRDDGPMAPERVARVGLGVLAALRAAHRAGLLHRDVKPGNVLLAHDGRVVLTDFGLATAAGDAGMTSTGVVLGSPQYLAPERALDGEVGPPADLWSLGATLYAAVEGRPPYVRSSPMTTLAALATELPDPPERAGILRHALTALLQRDPARRADAETAQRLLLAATVPGSPPPADVPAFAEPTFAAPNTRTPAPVLPPAPPSVPPPTAGRPVPPAPGQPGSPGPSSAPGQPASGHGDSAPGQSSSGNGDFAPGVGFATGQSVSPAQSGALASPAGAATAVSPPVTTAGTPADRPARRRGLIAAGVGAALLVAGAIVYSLVTRADPAIPQALPSASQPGEAAGAGVPLPGPSSSRSGRPRRSAAADQVNPAGSASGEPSVSPPAAAGQKPSAGTSTGPSPVTTTDVAVTGTVFASKGTGTCLYAPASGGRIQSYACKSSAAGQRFTVGPNQTLLVRGKCVQVDGTSDGSGLRSATCDGSDAQRWHYNSSFDLVSLWGTKCVDIPDASSANGVAVQVWECSGESHQKWDHTE